MGKSSTERSRERRARIYKNKKLYEQLKEEDRMRKTVQIERLPRKDWIMKMTVLHRIKQRKSKKKYHAKKKTLNELTNEVSFSTPQKQVIKNKMRKLWWKYQESSTISNSSIVTPESTTPNTNTQQATEVASPMLVSSSLWGCLSPSTKKKVKSKLQNEQLPIGMNTQIRKELGINLSINARENNSSSTVLQKSIEDFFLRVSPETKK